MIPEMESVESSLEQRLRAMQDAYMDVSGRTTQETKSSSYRGDKVEQLPTNSDRDNGYSLIAYSAD